MDEAEDKQFYRQLVCSALVMAGIGAPYDTADHAEWVCDIADAVFTETKKREEKDV